MLYAVYAACILHTLTRAIDIAYEIHVWRTHASLRAGQLQQTLCGHMDSVTTACFNRNSTLLVSGSCDCTVRVWNLGSSAATYTLSDHTGTVQCVALAPVAQTGTDGSDHGSSNNARVLASASKDGTVRLFDVARGVQMSVLTGHEGEVWCVAWSADASLLASGGDDEFVRVWDASTGMQAAEPLQGHEAGIWCVAFSSDDAMLISASSDKTIRVWSATAFQPIRLLLGHLADVTCVAFSPDCWQIVSGGLDGTVRRWDARNGVHLGLLEGPRDKVWSVAWSPDGVHVCGGSEDTAYVWHMDTQVCVRL